MSKYVQNLRQLAVIVAKKYSCQFYFTVKYKISDNFTVFFLTLRVRFSSKYLLESEFVCIFAVLFSEQKHH